MTRYPLVHCDFDDEDCCSVCREKNNGTYYKVVEGSEFCPRHGGAKQANKRKVEAANQYRLSVWQHRLNEFAESDSIKSLRAEVGILRIILEEMMNKCHDRTDLVMYSSKISDLAIKIEKLVSSCDRLERNMGEMMDKPTALKFASKVVDIVGRHVTDSRQLDSISHEILEELRR